jgi:hypothetical protein
MCECLTLWPFPDAFAPCKASIKTTLSACLPATAWKWLNGFYKILFWKVLLKFVDIFRFRIKLKKNNGHIAWRPIRVSALLRERVGFHGCIVETERSFSSSKYLWNVGRFPLDFTAQQPRSQSSCDLRTLCISLLIPFKVESTARVVKLMYYSFTCLTAMTCLAFETVV